MTVLLAQAVGREAYLVKRHSFSDSDAARVSILRPQDAQKGRSARLRVGIPITYNLS
jgi:hypothetical protein